jgi:hypothetical protein
MRRSSPRRAHCQTFTAAAASEFHRCCLYVRPVSSDLPWMSLLPVPRLLFPSLAIKREEHGRRRRCWSSLRCLAVSTKFPRWPPSQPARFSPDELLVLIESVAKAGEMRFLFSFLIGVDFMGFIQLGFICTYTQHQIDSGPGLLPVRVRDEKNTDQRMDEPVSLQKLTYQARRKEPNHGTLAYFIIR